MKEFENGEAMTTKERILELLKNAAGQSVSGEEIAANMNISRNAVWKAVGELKKKGYEISAVRNKGYLLKASDVLSEREIAAYLSHTVTPARIITHSSLESTNKTAKEMAISGAEHGTVVVADTQTAGQGRRGRIFYSPPGQGLYMSVILRPEFLPFEEPALYTAFAAVAVCEAVQAVSGKSPGIKWVNDIVLNGKKICGILTEAVTDFESGGIQWVVLGAGINFSLPDADFPEELRGTAGSIFPDGKASATRGRLAAEVLNRILDPSGGSIVGRYRERLTTIGQTLTLTGPQGPYEAVAVDIDDACRLIVRCPEGSCYALRDGVIDAPVDYYGDGDK